MELFSIKAPRAVLLMASVLLVSASARGQYITLTAGIGKPSSETINIASNELATVVYLSTGMSAGLFVVCGGITNTYSVRELLPGDSNVVARHANLPIIAGPATLRVSAGTEPTFCTLQITKPGSNFTPINTVVIPNDSNGPVTIVLESSADMVNWVAANPGTYGTTSTNRFFRVRAQR